MTGIFALIQKRYLRTGQKKNDVAQNEKPCFQKVHSSDCRALFWTFYDFLSFHKEGLAFNSRIVYM